MAFPTGTPSAANVDQGTDSPAAARADLTTLINLVTQIIQSYAAANGICDLDANGQVPVARLPGGAGSGNDSDLLDGQHGTFYQNIANQIAGTLPAARFADSSHGNRAGGSLHALATQVVAGFMSGGDKARVDSIESLVISTIASAGGINQNQLKTATSNQSVFIADWATGQIALTGGDWTLSWFISSSSPSGLRIIPYSAAYGAGVAATGTGGGTLYLHSRYMQASPPYKIGETTWGHFVYLLRNISTGEIVGASEAEDPAWAYNGALHLPKDSPDRMAAFAHPFADYFERDPADDGLEIVLVDCRDLDVCAWKNQAATQKCNPLDELHNVIPLGPEKAHSHYGLSKITGFTDRVKIRLRS